MQKLVMKKRLTFALYAPFSPFVPAPNSGFITPVSNRMRWLHCSLVFAAFLNSHALAEPLRFCFGPARPGFTQVAAQSAYDASRGYGYLASPAATFAAAVPEGNYNVRIVFGNLAAATSTTVKAESRRLMIEKVETEPGRFETREFTLNVRQPAIRSGGVVGLKEGEKTAADWDGRLILEFDGSHPGVDSVEITPAPDATTVYLAGDSTVTDQRDEPWSSWGQMLPRFFGPGVAVANHAESGLALFSFEHQRRLEKILSTMRPGDYLFIQFGHNDQKDKTPGSGPYTTYKDNLKRYIAAVRGKGGLPVIVTSMERRRWVNGQPQPTLADFAEAARQVGAEEHVPVIDLNAMSLKLYAALGPDKSAKAFVHYPANTFPGQTAELKDDSHHNAYGGYELARCVVEGIKKQVPALAPYLSKDAGSFDPSRPDPPESFDVPPSPYSTAAAQKPAGS
jgi:lysophospholipase L1-like esterase